MIIKKQPMKVTVCLSLIQKIEMNLWRSVCPFVYLSFEPHLLEHFIKQFVIGCSLITMESQSTLCTLLFKQIMTSTLKRRNFRGEASLCYHSPSRLFQSSSHVIKVTTDIIIIIFIDYFIIILLLLSLLSYHHR